MSKVKPIKVGLVIMDKPINEIKSDPDRIRKHIDSEYVDGLAQNIRSIGIINSIEIDHNNVIVTGEVRWRAAKRAGLKVIPVRVIDPGNEMDRLARKLIENLQVSRGTSNMTDYDISHALIRLFKLIKAEEPYLSRDECIERISNRIGKSKEYISGFIYSGRWWM